LSQFTQTLLQLKGLEEKRRKAHNLSPRDCAARTVMGYLRKGRKEHQTLPYVDFQNADAILPYYTIPIARKGEFVYTRGSFSNN
jgi:hypothetical protein